MRTAISVGRNTPYGAPYGGLTDVLSLLNTGDSWWWKPARLAEQVDMARLIVAKFAAAGLPTGIALAGIANAQRESNLDPKSVTYLNVDGHRIDMNPWWRYTMPGINVNASVAATPPDKVAAGLFQLHGCSYCAGRGMSIKARWDPHTNINRIIATIKGPEGARLRAMADNGASVADLTYQFTVDIEKPASGAAGGHERANMARSFFGTAAEGDSRRLPQIPRALAIPLAMPWYVWAGLGVVTVAGGAWYFLGRR